MKIQLTDSKEKFKKIIPILAQIFLPVIVIVLVIQFAFMGATVYSESMQPTLNKGTKIVINKLAYTKKSVKRGDIIAYSEDGRLLVKRVVGMPGETVRFQDGFVIVDDKVYEEGYLGKNVETNTNEKFEVPKGAYFVLGDNRENSFDSRYAAMTYVKKKNIKGKVILSLGKGTTAITKKIKTSED